MQEAIGEGHPTQRRRSQPEHADTDVKMPWRQNGKTRPMLDETAHVPELMGLPKIAASSAAAQADTSVEYSKPVRYIIRPSTSCWATSLTWVQTCALVNHHLLIAQKGSNSACCDNGHKPLDAHCSILLQVEMQWRCCTQSPTCCWCLEHAICAYLQIQTLHDNCTRCHTVSCVGSRF